MFWTVALVGLGIALWLRFTTVYDLREDRLVISRGGWVWMEIPFAEIDAILVQSAFMDRFIQVRLFKTPPFFGRMTRIRKRSGVRYVLINPQVPDALIKAWESYRSAHPPELERYRYPGPELEELPALDRSPDG